MHKKFVVACLLTTSAEGHVQKESRTFSTMTHDLLAMLDWLQAAGCTRVAMESTSSYWRPIYNLLEGQFILLVGNAYHMKTVPGRKTDVKDAEWIADLWRHGLIRGSFIPTPAQRQLRDLTRYRTHLVHLQDTFCLRCLTRSNSKEIQTLLISTSAAKVREVQQYLS
jgi:transposase